MSSALNQGEFLLSQDPGAKEPGLAWEHGVTDLSCRTLHVPLRSSCTLLSSPFQINSNICCFLIFFLCYFKLWLHPLTLFRIHNFSCFLVPPMNCAPPAPPLHHVPFRFTFLPSSQWAHLPLATQRSGEDTAWRRTDALVQAPLAFMQPGWPSWGQNVANSQPSRPFVPAFTLHKPP